MASSLDISLPSPLIMSRVEENSAEPENSENVDFTALRRALDKLQAKLEIKEEEDRQRRETYNELKEEKDRIHALLDTVKAITGVSVKRVSYSEQGEICFEIEVKACCAEISLDKKKRIHSLKILSKDFAWIDTEQILQDARQLPEPHDLRCAVHRLGELQP